MTPLEAVILAGLLVIIAASAWKVVDAFRNAPLMCPRCGRRLDSPLCPVCDREILEELEQ